MEFAAAGPVPGRHRGLVGMQTRVRRTCDDRNMLQSTTLKFSAHEGRWQLSGDKSPTRKDTSQTE
jgi:hypothetical protein